ncbi:hypothetical protein JCM8208_004863 [Rhodotorula glutinis]
MASEASTVVLGQVAKAALHDVLPLLRQDSPGEPFVLGGTAALVLHAILRAGQGARPSVYGYLKDVQLPSQVMPVVLHAPSRYSAHELVDEQDALARSADSGARSHGRREPFGTSLFVKELPSERSLVVHLKLVNLHLSPTARTSFLTRAHVQGQSVSYIEWPLVLVEQLVLASTSPEWDRAALPALMVARWCLAIGRHDVALSREGRLIEMLRWTSVSAAVSAALGALLFVSELDALAAFWLERLDEGLAVRVAQYEWRWNALVRAEVDVRNLAGWYVEIFRRLRSILQRDQHPPRAGRRSSYIPVARDEQ